MSVRIDDHEPAGPIPAAARAVALTTLLSAQKAHLVLPVELWELVLSMVSAVLWRSGPHRVGIALKWNRAQRRLDGSAGGITVEQGTTTVWARPCRSWAWVLAAVQRTGPVHIMGINLLHFPYQSRRYCNGSRRRLEGGRWRALDISDSDDGTRATRAASIAACQEAWVIGDSLRPMTAAETEASGFIMISIEVQPGDCKLVDVAKTLTVFMTISLIKPYLPAWMQRIPMFLVYKGDSITAEKRICDTNITEGDVVDVWAYVPPGNLALRPGALSLRVIDVDDREFDVANIVDLMPPGLR